MTEEWRPTEFPNYEVSNLGRVRSLTRVIRQRGRWGNLMERVKEGALMTPGADSYGYMQVGISIDGVYRRPLVHHLVLAAFGPPRPEGFTADHANGDRADNRIENLRWLSMSDQGRNRHDVRNKHGVIGVIATRSPINPWMAMGRKKGSGEKQYLGMFRTKEEAGAAYRKFRDEQFA